jgi:hypothetical protein
MRLYSGLSSRDHKDAVTIKMYEDVLTGMALGQAKKRQGLSEPNSSVSFQDSLHIKKGEISIEASYRPVCGQSGPMSVLKPVKPGVRPIWRLSKRISVT